MLEVVLSLRARQDMVDIAAYTLANWDERQMARYVDGLQARFSALARFPDTGRRRDEIGRGLRSIVQGSHVVFYRVTKSTLVVIRVLHVRMNPAYHLI